MWRSDDVVEEDQVAWDEYESSDDVNDDRLTDSKQEESSSGDSEGAFLNVDDYYAVECMHCDQSLYHQNGETSSCDCCHREFDNDGSFSCVFCEYEICWNCWMDKRKAKVNILINKLKGNRIENKELSKRNSELTDQLLQLELSSVQQLPFATACARMTYGIDLIQ